MAFTKLTTDVENIQKLADRPQLSAQQLKAAFDGAGADIKQYLTETLVPELEAATAAGSDGGGQHRRYVSWRRRPAPGKQPQCAGQAELFI